MGGSSSRSSSGNGWHERLHQRHQQIVFNCNVCKIHLADVGCNEQKRCSGDGCLACCNATEESGGCKLFIRQTVDIRDHRMRVGLRRSPIDAISSEDAADLLMFMLMLLLMMMMMQMLLFMCMLPCCCPCCSLLMLLLLPLPLMPLMLMLLHDSLSLLKVMLALDSAAAGAGTAVGAAAVAATAES